MPSDSWPPEWFDPERYDLLTPANIKALAHPVRMSLMRQLRQGGPATASGLARQIGHSSGLTSYHLRVLAEAGLVVEDESIGNQRDRWWKAAREATAFSFRVPDAAGTREDLEAAEQYLRMYAQVSYERILAWVSSIPDRREELPHLPWQLHEAPLRLTHSEARELTEQIAALVASFRRDQFGRARGEGGPDARQSGIEPRHDAVLQFQLLPEDNDDGPHP